MVAMKLRGTDFGLRRPHQRVLEQFYDDHRRFPNHEETLVFRVMFRVPADLIFRWCE